MELWQWLIVDFAVLAIGGLWLLFLLRNLANSAKKLVTDNRRLLDAIAKLQEASGSEAQYVAPKTNLEDSAFEKTEQLLGRLRMQDKKREAKKRRLIARFSKRK